MGSGWFWPFAPPAGRGQRFGGCRGNQIRHLRRLPRRQRQQRQSTVAVLGGPECRLSGRPAQALQGQCAHQQQRRHDRPGRAVERSGHRRPRGLFLAADAGGPRGRSFLLAGGAEALPRRRYCARAFPPAWPATARPARGNPEAGYPALRAQHAEYVVKESTDYAAGKRYTSNDKGDTSGGPNAAIMATIAQRLSPQDMRDLASYVQGLRES